ncbi:MAG: hypothetical protein LBB26_01370 [Puniceicoccales bacterium]|jgi:hypothetical protein|nr:hypothetical protein [Puniceicoccales bacterium]
MDCFSGPAAAVLGQNVWAAVKKFGLLVRKGTTPMDLLMAGHITSKQVVAGMKRSDCLTILRAAGIFFFSGGFFRTTESLRKQLAAVLRQRYGN